MGNKNKPPELYHEILRVARDASPQGVRAAYRTLARQWHPDKHPPESRPEAEARFKAITEAYEVRWPRVRCVHVFVSRVISIWLHCLCTVLTV
jgi:DnaJ family protein B protein 13